VPDWDLVDRGVVFWPVGNGDAVTIAVDEDMIIQVDINHSAEADEDDDDRVPVVDRLAQVLPKPAGAEKPVLAVLAISHHDADHCSGFERLIRDVNVCEIWLTLRSFVEEKDKPSGLTTEGKAVYKEACRRRKAEIDAAAQGRRAEPGDRLRIIGNSDVLDDPDWKEFPTSLLTSAGQYVPNINGKDLSDKVEVFIHTPFRDDTQDGSRNSSSLGMQLTLKASQCEKRFLLLGDLEDQQIEAFFDKSEERGNEERLEWDVLLAPHHCSRNAVRRQDGDRWVDGDAAEDFESYAADGARVVASCRAFEEASDQDTDPPHEDARAVYEHIVGKEAFVCTADYAKGSDSEPLTIAVTEDECGQVLESKAERIARLKTVGIVTGAARVRPGDSTGGTGDREYAS
jgi:beta-lactamase superfamily II metal-dependent hydrolase